MREIVLPETKPALEWVNGRVLQKVSPQRQHALAQAEFAAALGAWARQNGCGRFGTEWEFRVKPPGEVRRPLVPDVAYVSYARLPYDDTAAADIPRIAPDAVVEILSPDDRTRDVEEKLRVYFACGTQVVFLVDTRDATVTVRDSCGQRTVHRDEIVNHNSLPGFALPACTLFEEPRPRKS
jgi:Uma2 family endonuclease